MAMLPTKTKSTTLPDLIALHPKTVWNSNGSRNGIAPTTSQNIELPLMAAPKVGMRSVRRLMSGTGVRSRCQAPATNSAAAARTRTIASVQRGVPSDDDLAGVGDGAERAAGEQRRRACPAAAGSRSRCP